MKKLLFAIACCVSFFAVDSAEATDRFFFGRSSFRSFRTSQFQRQLEFQRQLAFERELALQRELRRQRFNQFRFNSFNRFNTGFVGFQAGRVRLGVDIGGGRCRGFFR